MGQRVPSGTQHAKTRRKELWFLFIDLHLVIQFLPQISTFEAHNKRKTKPPVQRPLGNKLLNYDIQLAGRHMPLILTTQKTELKEYCSMYIQETLVCS